MKIRVLLVDDEKEFIEPLSQRLQSGGSMSRQPRAEMGRWI